MHILVLSCGTGGGHNAAAEALVACARSLGEEAECVNFLGLAGPTYQKVLEQFYIKTVQTAPRLFGAAYGLAGQISDPDRHSPVYALNALLSGGLETYLGDHPVDAVVCTHLYPIEALTFLREKERLKQPVIGVATDYTCIPFWEETRCDRYIAAHPSCVGECAARGMEAARILPYGIPVDAAFRNPPERREARRILGLAPEGRLYLLMGGSMGFGQIPDLCDALLGLIAPEDHVVVICGSSKKLYQNVTDRYAAQPQVQVVGFTRQVAVYLAASDVLFTKPGGLSTTEAAVARKPMVLTAPIPGCETSNRDLFIRLGMAAGGDDAAAQAWFGRQLAEEPERAERMRQCQREQIPGDAAERIIALARELCR